MKTSLKNQSSRHPAARRTATPTRQLRPASPRLVTHVLHTLPDSLGERQELLAALAACIPPGEESGFQVRALQFHLEEHQRLSAEPVETPDLE